MSLNLDRRFILITLALLGISAFALADMSESLKLVIAVAVPLGVYYLLNAHKSFWYFISIFPFLPPYLAYKAGSMPFVNGFRIMLLFFLFDQLILKKRLPQFVAAFKHDKLKVAIVLYCVGIMIPGFVRAYAVNDISNLVSTIAIIVEKIVFYYLILMNIKIEIEREGSKAAFLSKFLHRISIVAFILAILGTIEYFMQFNVFALLDISNYEGLQYRPFIRSGQLRASSSFAHTLGYSMYLLLMIPIAFYQLRKAYQAKKGVFFYGLLSAILVLNLFMTLSRSSILALVGALAAYWLFSNVKGKIQVVFISCFVLLPIMIASLSPLGESVPVLSTVGDNVKALSDSLFDTQLVDEEDFGNNDDPFAYRNKLISYAFSSHGVFADAFGTGIGYIESHPLEFDIPELNKWGATISNSVDNYYALVKLEQGYVALAATMILFLTAVFTVLRYRKVSPLNMAFLVAFLGYFFELIMVADLDTLKYFFILLALFSVYHNFSESDSLKPKSLT